jgi:hypothetical protein
MEDLTSGIAAYSQKNKLLEGKINPDIGKEIEAEMKSGNLEKNIRIRGFQENP